MSGPRNRRRQSPLQTFKPRPPIPRNDGKSTRAGSSKDTAEEGKYTLLSFLACAQQYNIDFAGISWIETQGKLGSGGQGMVMQMRGSIDTVFAFKRRIPPKTNALFPRSAAVKENAFREICFETMALGHEELRRHKNIVQLMAIAWEIEKISLVNKKIAVWPVIMLEKAEFGDLRNFLRKDGAGTDTETRLGMCADIASALAAVHKNGIIHGDIKPENALVFTGNVVKLSDFGFSAVASRKSIILGGTDPWRAPELTSYHSVTYEQAKLTDLYSFGMLCLWTIFNKELAKMRNVESTPTHPAWRTSKVGLRGLGITASILKRISTLVSSSRKSTITDERFDLEPLKLNNIPGPTNGMTDLARNLVQGLHEGMIREYLEGLFKRLLAFSPSFRTSQDTATDFEQISRDLLEIRQGVAVNTTKAPRSPSAHTDGMPSLHASQKGKPSHPEEIPGSRKFEVYKSLETLCYADFRVRKHTFDCLEAEYREAKDEGTKAALAVQLAFCKKVGFGTDRNSIYADNYRSEGHIEDAELQRMINATRIGQKPFNAKLREMYANGIIQSVHYGTEFRFETDSNVLKRIQQSRETEIQRMESALGKMHPAILSLKWSLWCMLGDEVDVDPIKHSYKMLLELNADPNHGLHHRDSLIARCYFCASLDLIFNPNTANIILEYNRKTHAALVSHPGLKDHVMAMTLSKNISWILAYIGQTRESMVFLENAEAIATRLFGYNHANTVGLLDIKTDILMREGRIQDSLATLHEMLQRVEGLIDKDDTFKIYLHRKTIDIYVMTGQFKDALQAVETVFDLMRARNMPESHEFYIDGFILKANILSDEALFEEAAEYTRKVLRIQKRQPWRSSSPPSQRNDKEDSQMSVLDFIDKLKELLNNSNTVSPLEMGTDDSEWAVFKDRHILLPSILPKNPELLNTEAMLAMTLHAQAHQLTTKKSPTRGPAVDPDSTARQAARISGEADDYLRKFLRAVGKMLEEGSRTVPTTSQRQVVPAEAACRASSSILHAMDMELAVPVELVSILGWRNARSGMHYEKAIGMALKMNLKCVHDILAEHRLLCADMEPDADNAATFKNAADLEKWLAGQWTGAYLSENGNGRRGQTGHRTITFEASSAQPSTHAGSDRGVPWDVDVWGTSEDNMGKWKVKGQAWVNRKIVLHIFHEKGKENQGWQYTGCAHRDQRALGGYWGITGVNRRAAGGVFLFYKFA